MIEYSQEVLHSISVFPWIRKKEKTVKKVVHHVVCNKVWAMYIAPYMILFSSYDQPVNSVFSLQDRFSSPVIKIDTWQEMRKEGRLMRGQPDATIGL
jgi:hypothetical protein